jgi:hypothetical protein
MGGVYSNDEIALMKSVLDEAWETLPVEKRASVSLLDLAQNILRAAAKGERDPDRLKASALRVNVIRGARPTQAQRAC